MLAAGFTQADIDVIRTHFDVDVSQLPVDTTLQGIVRDLAGALEDAIPDFDQLTREAAAVAGRTNEPPAASFTASPTKSSSPPTTVQFTDTVNEPGPRRDPSPGRRTSAMARQPRV